MRSKSGDDHWWLSSRRRSAFILRLLVEYGGSCSRWTTSGQSQQTSRLTQHRYALAPDWLPRAAADFDAVLRIPGSAYFALHATRDLVRRPLSHTVCWPFREQLFPTGIVAKFLLILMSVKQPKIGNRIADHASVWLEVCTKFLSRKRMPCRLIKCNIVITVVSISFFIIAFRHSTVHLSSESQG